MSQRRASSGRGSARERMVARLHARGIRDPRVLAALRSVPRHLLVPEALRHRAYEESALPIGEGQTISAPGVVAAMSQALALRGGEKVLEIAIGREVRAHRLQQGITVAELSAKTGISAGMLSKIENGQVAPSLATLSALAEAMNVPISAFFTPFEQSRDVTYVPKGQGLEIDRRGTRAGHGAARGH